MPISVALKPVVKGMYDIQKIRISVSNRIVAQWKTKVLGIPQGVKEDKIKSKDIKKLLKTLKKEYKLITDGILSLPSPTNFQGTDLISDFTQLVLINQYFRLKEEEQKHLGYIAKIVRDHPLWDQFFNTIDGCGELMAAVILISFDIEKCKYVSTMWAYAGLDVVIDPETGKGSGRSKRKEHLVEREYIDKAGHKAKKMSVTYNPFLKTKLMGVFAPCLKKAKKGKGNMAHFYDNYKQRIENMPEHADKTKGHRHRMAERYMIKMIIQQLYPIWRELEGFPVTKPYAEKKLKIVHKAG